MVGLLGHRQPKGAATAKLDLQPPRHISTLPILFARTSPACQDCALRQSQLQLSSRRPKGWFQTILLISLLYTTQVKEQAASLQTALLRSDGLRGPR
jgi:hypothetical protein